MTWRKLLVFIFLVELLLALTIVMIVFKPVDTEKREFMNLRSSFPSGRYETRRDGNWTGYSFSAGLRLLSRIFPDPEMAFNEIVAEVFSGESWRQEIDLGDMGTAILQSRGRGYVVYVIFRQGDTVYWLDLVSKNSLAKGMDFFNRFLLDLEVAGRPGGLRLARQLEQLWAKLPWFLRVSRFTAFSLLAGFIVFVFCVIWIILARMGRCPDAGGHEFCVSGVTMIKRKPGGWNLAPCCLAREGKHLLVYRSAREIMRIDLQDAREEMTLSGRILRFRQVRFVLSAREAFRIAAVL